MPHGEPKPAVRRYDPAIVIQLSFSLVMDAEVALIASGISAGVFHDPAVLIIAQTLELHHGKGTVDVQQTRLHGVKLLQFQPLPHAGDADAIEFIDLIHGKNIEIHLRKVFQYGRWDIQLFERVGFAVAAENALDIVHAVVGIDFQQTCIIGAGFSRCLDEYLGRALVAELLHRLLEAADGLQITLVLPARDVHALPPVSFQ